MKTDTRRVSPSGEHPPASRATTTVSSAHLAGSLEANAHVIPVGASSSTTHDRQPPSHSAPTPLRWGSMFEPPHQLSTPRGSLQWPSTHRSLSSATATRDSSRHSQAADRLNTVGMSASSSATAATATATAAATQGPHERTRSSVSHTPLSFRYDHSEPRLSVVNGAGSRQGCRSNMKRQPCVPPLVDVGDSPSLSQHSAPHSMCATSLSTPREGVAGTSHLTAASTSLNADAFNSSVNLSPPPLSDFEAEAQQLTREQLEEQVEEKRASNVVLRTSVLRLRESVAALQEGMLAGHADLERRQEGIVNAVLRRLEMTKRYRGQLVAKLRAVETEKAAKEAQLASTTQSIKDLSRHLQKEEREIADRLQHRLERLQVRRQQLEHVLEEHSSSLQQLQDLVQEMEEMHPRESNTMPTATVRAASLDTRGSSLGAGAVPFFDLGAAAPERAPVPWSVPGSLDSTTSHPMAGPTHERSSSRISVASSNNATTPNPAYDPTAMIRYLTEEIAAAQELHKEALFKAEKYTATRERLERRLALERRQRAEQQSCTQALRQQLHDASSAANEKAAAQEVATELEVDRYIHSARGCGGDIISSASSTCATPKMRPVNTLVSRANSLSPGSSRPAPIQGILDLDIRTQDSFLLPSNCSTSGMQAVPFGHVDPATSSGGAPVVLARTSSFRSAAPSAPTVDPAQPNLSFISLSAGKASEEVTSTAADAAHTRLQVQNTSRMDAPRPVKSVESTPQRTPPSIPSSVAVLPPMAATTTQTQPL